MSRASARAADRNERSVVHPPVSGVRPYRADDEPAVLALLQGSLKRWERCADPAALWRWKHDANPFGRSCVLVHETPDGEVAGMVALLFWRLRQGTRVLLAERTTDMVTHPAHRRRGIASSFHAPARQRLIEAGVQLVFHTPNQHSIRFTRRSDRPVFEVRSRFGVPRAGRLPLAALGLGGRRSHERASEPPGAFRRVPTSVEAFLDGPGLASLLARDAARRGARLHTERSADYLRWRYAQHPTIRYYACAVERLGRLDACLIFRLDRVGAARRLVAQDLLLGASDAVTLGRLREELDATVGVDLVQHLDSEGISSQVLPTARFPNWNAWAFTVGVYGRFDEASPLALDHWSLSLGDLEEI